jgi:hypothetical protein
MYLSSSLCIAVGPTSMVCRRDDPY